MAEARAMRLGRMARPLFFATIVTGSFLLFLTQPMIARMALPRLGGAPAVWNSAMLVYQALLLAGYGWAHWLARLAPARQVALHLLLFALAAFWLPIGLSHALPPSGMSPAVWTPWFLFGSIGPLFLAISAQAPLMQSWYALEEERGEPYALYAASNLGSFAGLIAYPLAVEPFLSLRAQSWIWTAGYSLLALLLVACALAVKDRAGGHRAKPLSPAPSWRRRFHWLALAAVPSGLMLSTTTHLTTDIVAMPLLWVLPLGLYLLSFVIAFSIKRLPTDAITRLAPVILLIGGGFAFVSGGSRPVLSAALGLVLLFTVAVALHGELYRLRPASDRLTAFYLVTAVGGVLGGLFCALVAPAIFDWTYEHPLLLLAAAFLLPQSPLWSGLTRIRPAILAGYAAIALCLSLMTDEKIWPIATPGAALAATTCITVAAILAVGRKGLFTAMLAALMLSHGGWTTLDISRFDIRTRSYFGVYSVGDRGTERVLTHGTTMHGVQDMRPGRGRVPTTYYAPKSGVGQVMARSLDLYGYGASVGVVGLGTGTLACYKRPGQYWTFFEIDPKMVRLARDSGYFTFLSGCAPDARIVLGDARVSLSGERNGSFDILAIDAFSSDAVPMHLLTREAVAMYGRTLRPNGIVLFHISNRFMNLEPAIAAAAKEQGWHGAILDYAPDAKETADLAAHSVWVALTRDPTMLGRIRGKPASGTVWRDLEEHRGFEGWTDDFGSILPLLKIWEQ